MNVENVDHGADVRGRRVAVAMSGGVDSSVAALLLRQSGADVVGATLRMRDCAEDTGGTCCAADAESSAAAVCVALGIPHHVIDCRAEFEAGVLRYSWAEYSMGRTPSPCIVCNERIKFGFLRAWAAQNGADLMATGHYASLSTDMPRAFTRPADRRKDQTYFLCRVLPDPGLLFPLEKLSKTEVRAIAAAAGLAVAGRPDSQDACFMSSGETFAELLRRRFDGAVRPGRFLDAAGRCVGAHDGIHRFTVGQSRGFCIGDGRKWWVESIDPDTADIAVTNDPVRLNCDSMVVSNVVSVGYDNGTERLVGQAGAGLSVVVRHGSEPVPITCADAGNGSVRVVFERPVRAVTPGQAAVFYDGTRLAAAAWIDGR